MSSWSTHRFTLGDTFLPALLAVILIASALFFFQLGTKSIWLDEAFTYHDSRLPLHEIIESPRSSFDLPPLWFLLTRASLAAFGDNDTALRLPAALAAVLAVAAIGWLGATMFDRATGVFAAFLLAANPFMLAFAQEARPYSMQVFLGLVSTGALWLGLQQATRRGPWVAFAVATVAAVYVTYMAVLVVAAQLCIALLWAVTRLDREARHRLILLSGSLAIVVIAFLPRLDSFFAALQTSNTVPPPIGPGLPGSSTALVIRVARNVLFAREAFWWMNLYGSSAAAVLSSTLAAFAIWRDTRNGRRRTAMAWLLVLLIVPVGLLLFSARTTWTRYYLVALPWVILLVARGLSLAGQRVLARWRSSEIEAADRQTAVGAAALLMILLAFHLPSWAAYFRGDQGYYRDKADWKGAARHIEQAWRPGELIMAADLHSQLCLSRYLPAVHPASHQELQALLRSSERGYMVDGGWRNRSALVTAQPELTELQATRLTFESSHVWLYEWGDSPDPLPDTGTTSWEGDVGSIEIDFARRSRAMFLRRGWNRGTYREGASAFGVIDQEVGEISVILPPGATDRSWRISLEARPLSADHVNLTLSLNGSAFAQRTLEESLTTIEANLPGALIRSGSNVIGLRVEAPNPFRHDHPLLDRVGLPWPADITVHSVGPPRGDFGWIFVGGRRYSWEEARRGVGRGYNLMVIAPDGRIVAWDSFDTCCLPRGETESARLAALIERTPAGHIIAVTTRGDAAGGLTDQAVAALRRIGAEEDLREHAGWVHAIVGVKDLGPGAAAEVIDRGEARIVIGANPEAEILLVRRIRIAPSN